MKILRICVLIVVSMTLTFCSTDTIETEEFEVANLTTMSIEVQECGSVDLLAGQFIDSGDFKIAESGSGDLVLTYETTNGWELEEIHLYAGSFEDMPVNRGGNPRIGHFPIKETFSNGVTSFTTTVAAAGDDLFCGFIAAHAVVSKDGQTETAWADGLDFSGRSWATYIDFCGCEGTVDPVVPDPVDPDPTDPIDP